MSAEELLSRTRKHLWAAWALSSEEIGSQAAATLLGLGMLVPEGGAAELESLRARVAGLEAEKKRAAAHAEHLATTLVARTQDLMAAEARVAELLAERHASDESPRRRNRITRAHLEAVADVYNAAHAEGEPPSRAVADVFGTPYDTATKWVSRARQLKLIPPAAKSKVPSLEDPHDSPLHHDYRQGRDLPETGGAR